MSSIRNVIKNKVFIIAEIGVNHNGNLKLAKKVVLNAKLRNTAICGATETILFHKKIIKKMINPILKNLENHGCKIIGDNETRKFYEGNILQANE